MNDMLNAMNGKLDKVLKAQYDTYLQGFDKSVNDMGTYAAGVQEIYNTAMGDLDTLGLTMPADDATAEELAQFEKDLVDAIIAQDKAGNRDYEGYQLKMNELEKNYVTATNMVISGKGDSSPFYYYDQIWTMYFNYETQPYYLRKAYRTNVEFQIKNAYNLLAVRYNLSAKPGRQAALTTNLTNAIDEIARHPAGLSPETKWKDGKNILTCFYGQPVYCYTINRLVHHVGGGMYRASSNEELSDDMLREYVKRLHGGTVRDDLILAGSTFAEANDYEGLAWRYIYKSSGGSYCWDRRNFLDSGAWFYALVIFNNGTWGGIQTYDEYGTDRRTFFIIYI